MNDCVTNILRKDMNLYRRYTRAGTGYILSSEKKLTLMDIELDIDDKVFNKFIKQLAKKRICLDEFVVD